LKEPVKLYEKRKNKYKELFEKFTRSTDMISNLRLIVFLVGAAGAITLFVIRYFYLFSAEFVIFVVIFIWLILKHGKLLEFKKYSALLLKTNEDSLKRLNGEWTSFQDNGEEFKDESHSFSNDLDIFGDNSLFQCINTASTYLGRQVLKRSLLEVPKSVNFVQKKQEAIKELATKLMWRQRFFVEGLLNSNKMHDPEDLVSWSKEKYDFFRKPWVIAGVTILPLITVCLLISAFAMHLIPKYVPVLTLIIQFILLGIKRKKRDGIFNIAAKYKDDIKAYHKMLRFLEKHSFNSSLIKEIKATMSDFGGIEASKQIDKLSKIIDSTSDRYNIFYFIFNAITLWDYRNLIKLEKWKIKSGKYIRNWIEAISEMEALCSLSTIVFDHPTWVIPQITSNKTIFIAEDMGHPLLKESGIHNDLSLKSPTKVLLVTGSNMSGKSTFLRTSGINLVLAYSGASVCAKAFVASIMEIYTCMRVSDNLGKSISSFYAELLRIKTIVNAEAEEKNIFFLLDEIFKGTNSKDRHAGAKVLIKKLSETDSIGMVSTHDLELCEMEKENNKIKNYHFQEYYKDNMIHFDYKLRPGASTTRNAIFLMKMAGIEIDDEIKL